jgi:hypothetical protein
MRFAQLIALIGALSFGGAALAAESIVLNPNQPGRYVVRQGDTLWDIASKFLRDPWRWPDVWDFANKVDNPQYVYPGDIIVLDRSSGKPMLKVQRGTAQKPTVRLSPKIRATKLDRAIPSLPVDAVKQFIPQPRVLTERELKNSAYIVSTNGSHLITTVGDQIYAKGLPPSKNNTYSIYRTGKTYQNVGGKQDEVLGYEGILVGVAQLRSSGDPATLQIVEANREALIGDLLVPMVRNESEGNWIPRAPDAPMEGRIIDVIDAVARVGQYQTVVLNLGEFDGVQRGHVLAVYHKGGDARDVVSNDPRATVELPDYRSGLAMVFKTFDRVSYALIMKAEEDIRLHDMVRKP